MQRRGKRTILGTIGVFTVAVLALVIYAATQPIVHTPEGKTRAYVRILSEVTEQYRRDKGRYPTISEWSHVVSSRGEPIRDGWGNPLQYRYPSQREGVPFELWSFGADGKPGGEGADADIGNWKG